jgi:hypothetical protein
MCKGILHAAITICCLLGLRAQAVTAIITCQTCPSGATAAGVAPGIFVTDDTGHNVLPGVPVGACHTITVHTDLSYKATFPGNVIGAAYYGGTVNVLASPGSVFDSGNVESTSDVTAASLANTIIGPAAPAAPCQVGITQTDDLAMNNLTYTFTAADIANGGVSFHLSYANGTTLISPCSLKASGSVEFKVTIAAAPTCTVPAPTAVCAGTTATAGPVNVTLDPAATVASYCWQKGCPPAADAPCLSTTDTLSIPNAQASDAGCYTVTVTDSLGCTTTCTATLVVNPCNPVITVLKQVVCKDPNTACEANTGYSHSASGVQGGAADDCPVFCYSIRIENTGDVDLTGITVTDNQYNLADKLNGNPGDPNAPFPTSLPAHSGADSVAIRYFSATVCDTTGSTPTVDCTLPDPVTDTLINTVTVNATSTAGAAPTVTSCAAVQVKKINVTCDLQLVAATGFDLDNNPNDNHVTMPAGSTDVSIETALKITNTGTAPLKVTSISVTDCANPPNPISLVTCGGVTPVDFNTTIFANGPISVSPNNGFVDLGNIGCWVVSCPGGCLKVTVNAQADDQVPGVCITDQSGNPVTATTTCQANVDCQQPATCRVTGGGVLTPGVSYTTTCPVPITETTMLSGTLCNNTPTVVQVTHGGQLGAPYAQQDCGDILGDPCIRGQWQHVRHYQGKGSPRSEVTVDTIHTTNPKGTFDLLKCACLPCCELGVTGASPSTLGTLCNPDDHKICGPEPRPAPANAIIFSGVAMLRSCVSSGNNGKGSEIPVVFMVYIEDRSEPGGLHPKGSVNPPDVYCFQAWAIQGNNFNSGDAQALRQAVAQAGCAYISNHAEGAMPPSTVTVGNTTATSFIDDCGPLDRGNHQIHPSTSATCNATTP